MAELAPKGTYVKMEVDVWFSATQDRVHITSSDKSLAKGGLHMSAKKGTASDVNLRMMLDKFGCGPVKATEPIKSDPLTKAIESGKYDADLDKLNLLIAERQAATQTE